jgi:hypothetical protein
LSLNAPAVAVRRAPRRWTTQHGSALLSARTPTSNVYATREPGWLPITNLALQGRLPHGVVVPQRDFVIVARQQGEVPHLDDVVGPDLPALEEVLTAIPFRFERVIYGFTPDRPRGVPRTFHSR